MARCRWACELCSTSEIVPPLPPLYISLLNCHVTRRVRFHGAGGGQVRTCRLKRGCLVQGQPLAPKSQSWMWQDEDGHKSRRGLKCMKDVSEATWAGATIWQLRGDNTRFSATCCWLSAAMTNRGFLFRYTTSHPRWPFKKKKLNLTINHKSNTNLCFQDMWH